MESAGKVLLTLSGAPDQPDASTVPCHKKNPAAGTKQLVKLNKVWLDQADAQQIKEGEEVTLMDWGNAIVKVRGSTGLGDRFGRGILWVCFWFGIGFVGKRLLLR